jgi:predicted SAM-dependent methyltransferase
MEGNLLLVLKLGLNENPNVEQGTADEIFCTDIIEAFQYAKLKVAFLRWWDALKVDGKLEINVVGDGNNYVELLSDLGFGGFHFENLSKWNLEIVCTKQDAYDSSRRAWDITIQPGETVLEVGPGEHPFAGATRYLDIIERKLPNQDIGSVEAMPYSDKSFETVLCAHVLEHTESPEKAIAELQRVGKRGIIELPSTHKDWIMQHGGVHTRWQILSCGEKLIFVALTPDKLRFFTNSSMQNYIHRITQMSGVNDYTGYVLRRAFWESNVLLNPMVTWDENKKIEVGVIRA